MNYPTPTPEQFKKFWSETPKYQFLTARYCYRADGQPGCGVDIASQGAVVVPWALSFDLPLEEFNHYCSNQPPKGPIHLRGHADQLPFDTDSLDWLYASHILEDYLDWTPILKEWVRVVKPGGFVIILVPDKELWAAALAAGQPPNCAHRHESYVGEISTYAAEMGVAVIEDRLTAVIPEDYTVMFVGIKK